MSGDEKGFVHIRETNMNMAKIIKAHDNEICNDLDFSPSTNCMKFVTCSNDHTCKIWDFQQGIEERELSGPRGHGNDVKSCNWHPYKCLIATGGKDNVVKLWDPRQDESLLTLHSHNNTVTRVRWHWNGNYLVTASRDQLLKLHDLRTFNEIETYKGH